MVTRYLSEYEEGDRFSGVLLCTKKSTKQDKTGRKFLSMTVRDKTKIVQCMLFSLEDRIASGAVDDEFDAPAFIRVDGTVDDYNGTLQIVASSLRPAHEFEYDAADFAKESTKNRHAMYTELTQILHDQVSDPYVQKLLSSFFEDKEFKKRFMEKPGAKSMHHAFIGGLLEHTLGVVKNCVSLADNYSDKCNKSVLIAAGALHDVGKLDELGDLPGTDYTAEGNMLGHLLLGYEQVKAHIAQIPGFPEDVAQNILHCIASHHGVREYGAIATPQTMEALLLNFADDIDAKVEMASELSEAGKTPIEISRQIYS